MRLQYLTFVTQEGEPRLVRSGAQDFTVARLRQQLYDEEDAGTPRGPTLIVLAEAEAETQDEGDASDLSAWLAAIYPDATPSGIAATARDLSELVQPDAPTTVTGRVRHGETARSQVLRLAVPTVERDGDAVEVRWAGLGIVATNTSVLLVAAPVAGAQVTPSAAPTLFRVLAGGNERRARTQKENGAAFDFLVPAPEAFGYVMHGVARQFGEAIETLLSIHEEWEAEFFRDIPVAGRTRSVERETLYSLGEAGLAIRRNITQLLRSRNQVWGWLLPTVVADPPEEDGAALLAAHVEALRVLRADVRESLDLVASRDLGAQLEAQKSAQDAAGRFQLIVTLVTSLVLVPGLIASFWGASVTLPWKDRIEGTALLLGLMAVAGWATLALLLRVEREQMSWQQVIDHLKYDLLALRRPEDGEGV